jgi:hypothetical protein
MSIAYATYRLTYVDASTYAGSLFADAIARSRGKGHRSPLRDDEERWQQRSWDAIMKERGLEAEDRLL